jgi:hypothetical protein
MHAPAMSGREARALLDKMLAEFKSTLELDRDIFEEAYRTSGILDEHRLAFERFCRTGELSIVVVAHCQSKLWRDKL